MTAVALPQPESLPCQRDPERWFDREQRAAAVAGCRGCPIRRWCAREALECRASWGVWAGVWIDGDHNEAAPHLRAVADGTLAQSAAIATAQLAEVEREIAPTGDRLSPAPPQLSQRRRPPQPSSVAAAVLVRGSGHCEVFADGCRYTYNTLVSRYRSATRRNQTPSPAAVFAACSPCADMIAALPRSHAAELGYLVDSRRDPAQVPFYWRASRWVLLTRDGWLTDLPEHTRQVAV